jgi:polysaccharide biosynthesis protein PslF
MRIAVVCSQHPPLTFPEAIHASMLCTRLAERGLDTHLVTSTGVDAARGHYHLHPNISRWNWRAAPRLLSTLQEIQPDAVLLIYLDHIYANGHPMITYLPRLVRQDLPRCRFFVQFENVVASQVQWTPPRHVVTALRFCRRWFTSDRDDFHYGALLTESDGIITLCEGHRTHLARRNPEVAKKSIVIPAPPLLHLLDDSDHVHRARGREQLGIRADEVLLAFFGFIYPVKGISVQIRALEILRRQGLSPRLAVIGGTMSVRDEIYAQYLKYFAWKRGLSKQIFWTGNFDSESEKASTLLHAADLCVLPLHFGLKLHNSSFAAAAVHGLPVLSTTHAHPDPEIVHGENAWLVPPRQPEKLAEALKLLLQDAALRERLRQGSLRLAAQYFNWSAVLDQTIPFLCGAPHPALTLALPVQA